MSESRGSVGRAVGDVMLYSALRLALVAVLTGVIYGVARLIGVDDFPLVVALFFAFIVGLPLGIWLFGPQRRKATATVGAFSERRRHDREQLHARLRGDDTPADAPADDTPPDTPPSG